ncbi:hypothetical protein [Kosmotoga pacifica]|uniref:hypothetical protein n=1 Tax=Kosmotoga pacifica TaxID=1330330 RepID=UPI000B0AFF6C|nr:hypothetical protein [Kosmotoga pacifica]
MRLITEPGEERNYYQRVENADQSDRAAPNNRVRYIWGVKFIDMNSVSMLEDSV